MTKDPERLEKRPDGLAMLAVLSFVSGAVAGLIGAWFRMALGWADGLRAAAIARAQPLHLVGLVLVIAGCAAAVALAAWMVRRFAPYASGSGIPHVEAVILKQLPQAPVWLIPVKFIGGVLAIGSGLALGREGPSVQMGASAAHLLGTVFRRDSSDRLVLLAAGAGAGLATAFNAPIAGAIFVLEELVRRFDTRIAIATFGASTGAIAVSRLMLGDQPDFGVELQPYPGFATVPIYLSLGVVAGLLGILYNRTTLGALSAAEKLRHLPVELRAAIIGGLVGLVAWFHPNLVGGGDAITRRTLLASETWRWLLAVLVLRFALGAISYAAGTPGGLFAPLLVLGAERAAVRFVVPTLGAGRRPRPKGPRGRGNGGLLHRSRPGARDGNCPRHRDDGKLHSPSPDAGCLFCCDAGANAAGQRANLRFLARSHAEIGSFKGAGRPIVQPSARNLRMHRSGENDLCALFKRASGKNAARPMKKPK